MAQRQVTTQHVGRNHAREINGRLGAAKLRCVAELRLFQIVDRPAKLDRHGKGIDTLVDPVPADCLRTQKATV